MFAFAFMRVPHLICFRIQSLPGHFYQLSFLKAVDKTAGLRAENSLQHPDDFVLSKHPIGLRGPAFQLRHLSDLSSQLFRHGCLFGLLTSPILELRLHLQLGLLRETLNFLQFLLVKSVARADHLTPPGREILPEESLELSVCE